MRWWRWRIHPTRWWRREISTRWRRETVATRRRWRGNPGKAHSGCKTRRSKTRRSTQRRRRAKRCHRTWSQPWWWRCRIYRRSGRICRLLWSLRLRPGSRLLLYVSCLRREVPMVRRKRQLVEVVAMVDSQYVPPVDRIRFHLLRRRRLRP